MKFRVIKIYLILRTLFKFNHWRGHGIHSPFMYSLVREVIVKRRTTHNNNLLPINLANYNLLKKDMLFVKNLYSYLGYENCIIVGESAPSDRTLCIAPMNTKAEDIEELLSEIEGKYDECCVTILGVNKSHEKYKLCRRIIKTKKSVSVDLFRTYIFFFNSKLHKQSYKLRNRII